MFKPAYYRNILLTSLLILGNTAYAEQDASYRQQIQQLAEKITSLGKTLDKKQQQRENEQVQLQKTEKQISKLLSKINQSETRVSQQKSRINKIQQQIENYNANKSQQTEQLSALLNSAYKVSKANYLKLLLNQENPYAVGRLNSYYKYFSQAQNEKIADIKMQLASLDDLKQQYQQQQEELADSQQQLLKQKKQLQTTRNRKKALLASLDKTINQTSQQIEKLETDRQRLSDLLGSFKKQPKSVPRYVPTSGSFADNKGKLPYPVNGNLKQKFGVYITANGLRSDGVFLQTDNKQSVRAVYRGKVLFADWFKGYGLMIIIDHGNNYMSLYGHNNKLYKKIGDIVETNEIISQTGTTGGLTNAGLYFEIRSNGSPVNPQLWCRR